MLFLSYAEEDAETAVAVKDWLAARGRDDVHLWERDRRQSVTEAEERISQAHDFVALLSPDYLAAPLCRREREVAICHEQDLRIKDPGSTFVHVLLARSTDDGPADGLPAPEQWLDITDRRHRESRLEELLTRLGAEAPDSATPGQGSVFFRNRSDELDLAIRGITNFGGPHFWLVIAPPQLGKTWFLDRLAAMLILGQQEPWNVRLLDIRDRKAEIRTDVGSLLRCLFGPDAPTTPERDSYITIAQKIIDSRQRHLCVIDSAELLAEDTARRIRVCLSEVHNIVSEAGLPDARFAVVIASRREDEWRGITPDPRLSILSLSEFNLPVVRDALNRLAHQMGRKFDRAAESRNADRLYRLSEGLPALLIRYLAWIRHENFVGMERLQSELLFRRFAQQYIENGLLARESLFPLRQEQPDAEAAGIAPSVVFDHALRVLSPYRLFTQSHLRHYYANDPRLLASMDDIGWTIADLWRAISGSALLTRPLDEPWQQIPTGIRRLLFRHYYPEDADRATAHAEARDFTAVWADQQTGKEQAIGLVECLWHEAAALRIREPGSLEANLIASARVLAQGLRGSEAYTEGELRVFAAKRISRDDEFHETAASEGLVAQVIETIRAP